MRFNFPLLLYCAALISLPAAAQAPRATPDPTDNRARVPVTEYASAFAGYVPYREQKLAPWRDVNDEVARVGGHVGIVRGSGASGHGGAPPKARPGADQPPVQGAPGGHSGR